MAEDARRRAARVRMVVMDVDGVLTDGRAFYAGSHVEGLLFNVQDGTGIKYLHRAGIRTALLSGRDLACVRRRAEVLDIPEVIQGAKVKLDAYKELTARVDLADEEVAYIGDDLPDLPVLRRVGLAVAVPNARPEVRQAAHLVTERAGGEGAVRELAQFILKAQDKWDGILARYLSEPTEDR